MWCFCVSSALVERQKLQLNPEYKLLSYSNLLAKIVVKCRAFQMNRIYHFYITLIVSPLRLYCVSNNITLIDTIESMYVLTNLRM